MEIEMLILYIRVDDPFLTELTKRYDALFAQVEAVEAALSVANQTKGMRVNGGKRPNAKKEWPLWRERERCYEAACLELQRLVRVMHPFIEPVKEECKRLRDGPSIVHSNWWPTAFRSVYHRANTLAAERLYDVAAGYYRNCTVMYVPHSWLPMLSIAGSPYRFYGASNGDEVPPGHYMTEEEANQFAWDWVADIVGGDAKLYNVLTGEEKCRQIRITTETAPSSNGGQEAGVGR
jgi:hypothetical protein